MAEAEVRPLPLLGYGRIEGAAGQHYYLPTQIFRPSAIPAK